MHAEECERIGTETIPLFSGGFLAGIIVIATVARYLNLASQEKI